MHNAVNADDRHSAIVVPGRPAASNHAVAGFDSQWRGRREREITDSEQALILGELLGCHPRQVGIRPDKFGRRRQRPKEGVMVSPEELGGLQVPTTVSQRRIAA
jgi:hypothetical protein